MYRSPSFIVLLVLVGVGVSAGPAPDLSKGSLLTPQPMQPRHVAQDPYANRLIREQNTAENVLASYDRFLSRNTRLNEDLESMFAAWDANHDGQLSQHEVNLLCERQIITPAEYDVLMSFDVDGSGSVEHTEFKLGPLFVNTLEKDPARNAAFEKAAAQHPHPTAADAARFVSANSVELPSELGQHVLDARQLFRERLGLAEKQAVSSVNGLPLSSHPLAPRDLAAQAAASDVPPASHHPAIHAPVLLELGESVSFERVKLPSLDSLKMPELRTRSETAALDALLESVSTSVEQTLRHKDTPELRKDMSAVSFEKPISLDSVDAWVNKATDIMDKIKEKRIGRVVEEAIPATKFIEESWKRTQEAQARAKAMASTRAHSHTHAHMSDSDRVHRHRRARRERMAMPMPGDPAYAGFIQEGEMREGSAWEEGSVGRMSRSGVGRFNKHGRGPQSRVIGKEFYAPGAQQPAADVDQLRQRRTARLAQEQQAMQEMSAARSQAMLEENGHALTYDSLPPNPNPNANADGTDPASPELPLPQAVQAAPADAVMVQEQEQASDEQQRSGLGVESQSESEAQEQAQAQEQAETESQTQTEAESQEQQQQRLIREGEEVLAQEHAEHEHMQEAEPRLRQKQINVGGSASFGASFSAGASAKASGNALANVGASLSAGLKASANLKASASLNAGASLSVGAKASVGVKASASVGAKATVKPTLGPRIIVPPPVKITLKPVASTGDGLPVSKWGIPSYNDERCVLCQYLVQRTEANLYHRMLIVLDMDRQMSQFGTASYRPDVPQPAYNEASSSSGSADGVPTFETTTAPGGGAAGTTAGYVWDVLSRAYGGAAMNSRSRSGLDQGLWMDPTDPNNVDETTEPLSDYVMKEVNRHVTDYTDGRGHGMVRLTFEDTLSDFCAEDSLPELFYNYCPDFWAALNTMTDALYFGFHADAVCEEANMCGTTTYFNTQNAVHLPNKSRFFNAGRGVCGLVGGSRERKRGGKFLSISCSISKQLAKF